LLLFFWIHNWASLIGASAGASNPLAALMPASDANYGVSNLPLKSPNREALTDKRTSGDCFTTAKIRHIASPSKVR
jgi:hypothetical protein